MALYLSSKKERLNSSTQAFLYKWTHIPTQKWYVGSRTAVGCHINDGYIRKWVKKNLNGWKFQSKVKV